jgi:hypothetical protein
MTADKIFIIVNDHCMSLAAFKKMAADEIRTVYASGCTGLTELKADNAEYVDASGCTGLTELKAPRASVERADDSYRYVCGGVDSRGYLFEGVRLREQWRIVAGCRNFSIDDARKHWGPNGCSNRKDCLALVEIIVTRITEQEQAA